MSKSGGPPETAVGIVMAVILIVVGIEVASSPPVQLGAGVALLMLVVQMVASILKNKVATHNLMILVVGDIAAAGLGPATAGAFNPASPALGAVVVFTVTYALVALELSLAV